MWINAYSWGPMFVDCKHFAGSCTWGRNFVGNWFVHYNYTGLFLTLLNVRRDVNSLVRVTPEIHEHRSSTNNNDYTVCMKKFTKCLQLYTVGSLIALTLSILYLDI